MDERLLHILDDHDNIDIQALKKLTTRFSFNETLSIDWKKIEYFHLIQVTSRQLKQLGLKTGYYLNKDNNWLLLCGNYHESYHGYVNQCTQNLISLDIYSQKNQHWNVSHLVGLRSLRILFWRTGRSCKIYGASNLVNLESLILRNICIESTLDVSAMPSLKCLSLVNNNGDLTSDICGIEESINLEELTLWYVNCGKHLILTKLRKLKTLILLGADKLNSIEGLSHLIELETLRLCDIDGIKHIDVTELIHLNWLVLDYCKNLNEIQGLRHLINLHSLYLEYTGFTSIPVDILYLPHIKKIVLSGLRLDYLPDWLPELGLPISLDPKQEGICLYDCVIPGIDMDIFRKSQEFIVQWFDSQKVPLQEVKVVFLGDGEAGKTHTIARLLNDGNDPKPEDFDNKATPGIVIKDKPYILDGREVNVHYWDFGGQEILHSMHRMFLTERTLYVVLVNARDDTQDDRARYWLHNLKSFANDSPVLLVLNKIDQNPNASINETELRELYSGLRRVVKLSARDYSPEQFNAALTDALMEEIRSLGTIGTLWPTSWARLKDGLRNMSGNFIMGAEYRNMCRDCGVDKNQKELLHWFNDLGISFCYQGSRRLENYVILRPDWITNGIYTLLFNKSEETVNGVIPKQIIYDMLDPLEGSTYRRVKNTAYNMDETEYVLEVMRKFRLSYPVSAQAEFIPALCQRDSMPIAKTYAGDKTTLEFRMTYDYLPDNVIHRLMVEMRQDLQLTDVWRTGALFRQPGTGLSAVVKSEGDVLRIFVRSENDMHCPNTYLCILKENIDRINRDMRLAEPYAEVVYKYDSGSECFDYEDLLAALHDGDETYRSKKLRRQIPILDILNQTGFKEEQKLKTLQENILTACMQLQGNPTYQGAMEDTCNTYLRDALRNMGHLVYDQTFQGTGSGGKSFGELDLEIRQEPNIPWTILEALRITDGYKTTAWNRHLKKLLDNYNPSGLNHLFLLTYLHCETDDFGALMDKYSEHVKWYDPDDYQRLPSTFAHLPLRRHGDPAGLRVMRCTYDRSGAPTTVTHIFVRIAPWSRPPTKPVA